MSLRDHLFGAPQDERNFATPDVARFVPEAGEPFVLDRSAGREVYMKFEASPEIWALNPTPGPRGDVIYKDDMGEPILRATRLGGLTLFTPDRPEGMAAAYMGQGPALRPPPVFSASALLQSFTQASGRAGRAAGRSLLFQAENFPPGAAALIADAATLVGEAFVEVAATGDRGRRQLARFGKVRFDLGRNPVAEAKGDTVKITIAPERGLAGRPSSHRIAAALTKR
ncbi:MAG TPA: DUF4908 domain-containing protein [Caulobacteraceae bacterium]|nr:DUF4908 domain-containing protein [Caulobacteraceae bacterium]